MFKFEGKHICSCSVHRLASECKKRFRLNIFPASKEIIYDHAWTDQISLWQTRQFFLVFWPKPWVNKKEFLFFFFLNHGLTPLENTLRNIDFFKYAKIQIFPKGLTHYFGQNLKFPFLCFVVNFTYKYTTLAKKLGTLTSKNDAFSLSPAPPPPPHPGAVLCLQVFFQHIQHCWGVGGGGSKMGSFNDISKHL